ncbi:MAG: hypothetical protein ACI8UQ_002084, partial [Bacteroidia bacterium]
GYSLSSLFLLGSLLAAVWFGAAFWLIIAGLFLSNIIVSTIILSRKNSTLP